jgi:hypothetical protein
MKKHVHFFICDKCSSRLRSYGFICKDLVDTICDSYLKGRIVKYHEDQPSYFKTIIAFLEMKKIIRTTDGPDSYIYVKPVIEEGRGYFCWCKL